MIKMFLYRLLFLLGTPFIIMVLNKRRKIGKEDANPIRFAERRGIASKPRPKGTLVWILCASVGESLSIVPLIEDLKIENPNLNFLITTTTTTSAKVLSSRLPKYCLHQYTPVDKSAWIKRFLNHWQPDFLFTVDSEIWPNITRLTAKRGVKMGILNARMTEKTFNNWSKSKSFAKQIFGKYDLAIACSEKTKTMFKTLGVKETRYYGNLKNSYAPKPAEAKVLKELQTQIGKRNFWLSSSTHPKQAEEKLILASQKEILKSDKTALLILVPRHPEFNEQIKSWAETEGMQVAIRSKKEPITKDINVYIADTMGEMNLWYSLSQVVFMGGSLVEWGGHNPMEPAYMNCSIASGKHTKNFADVYEELQQHKAVELIANEKQLTKFVEKCFSNASADQNFKNNLMKNALNFAKKSSQIKTFFLRDIKEFINRKKL